MGWTVVPVESASEPGKIHNVTISDWSYICDCEGFHYRGSCRHYAAAQENRCRWEEGTKPCQTEEQRKTHICPSCGCETILVAEEER